jgi:hypothetical protein
VSQVLTSYICLNIFRYVTTYEEFYPANIARVLSFIAKKIPKEKPQNEDTDNPSSC